MIEFIATHDVDDVEHWFASPKRSEFFGPRGITTTPMRPADGDKTVALLVATPDMETFDKAMAEPEAQAAVEHDGVHLGTMKVFLGD